MEVSRGRSPVDDVTVFECCTGRFRGIDLVDTPVVRRPGHCQPRHLAMAGLVRAKLAGFGSEGEPGLGKEPLDRGWTEARDLSDSRRKPGESPAVRQGLTSVRGTSGQRPVPAWAGVIIRQRGLTVDQVGESVRLYRKGWSVARIGESFGVDGTTVWRSLQRQGVAMRKPHEQGSRTANR
jgi:hypothetical protein